MSVSLNMWMDFLGDFLRIKQGLPTLSPLQIKKEWKNKNCILTWCPFLQLDLHPQQANERGRPVAYDGSLVQYQQEVLPSNPVIPIFREKAANKVSILPSYLEEQQDVAALESKFVLPDLNIPFGEDSSTEILCGWADIVKHYTGILRQRKTSIMRSIYS